MASLTAEPTTATADAPPLSAKEYAAQRTRRRSTSGSNITVGRIVKTPTTTATLKTPTTTATVAPYLTGNFSGTGGAVGVSIRVEMVFDPDPTQQKVTAWIWSNMTESFSVHDISWTFDKETKEIVFGPEMMKGMEGRVVTKIHAKWDGVKDTIFLTITIKVGRWVPSVNITTTCFGVDTIVGGVKPVEGLGKKRVRPY